MLNHPLPTSRRCQAHQAPTNQSTTKPNSGGRPTNHDQDHHQRLDPAADPPPCPPAAPPTLHHHRHLNINEQIFAATPPSSPPWTDHDDDTDSILHQGTMLIHLELQEPSLFIFLAGGAFAITMIITGFQVGGRQPSKPRRSYKPAPSLPTPTPRHQGESSKQEAINQARRHLRMSNQGAKSPTRRLHGPPSKGEKVGSEEEAQAIARQKGKLSTFTTTTRKQLHHSSTSSETTGSANSRTPPKKPTHHQRASNGRRANSKGTNYYEDPTNR